MLIVVVSVAVAEIEVTEENEVVEFLWVGTIESVRFLRLGFGDGVTATAKFLGHEYDGLC